MRHLTPLRYIDAVARAGSIRKAADKLAITSTALNRRILSMEEDLGTPIFERLPQGVRLSVAGEILIHHIRSQLADMARVRSRIADLSGERRGHVSLVCSQSVVSTLVLPVVAAYRADHPAVSFSVKTSDRFGVAQEMQDHSADVAVIFEPEVFQNLDIVSALPQPVVVLCDRQHPLAGRHTVRLSECLAYPMALPASGSGVRHLVEQAALRLSYPLPMVIESNDQDVLSRSIEQDGMLSFQIPLALPTPAAERSIMQVWLDERDVPFGQLVVAQWRGRTLPVAAARFMDRLVASLEGCRQSVCGSSP